FPRDKTCGDGLTAQALRLLERLGVDVRALTDCTTVREAVLVSPSGRRVVLPLSPRGVTSAVVPRQVLDATLVAHACRRGVDVRTGAPLTALDGLPAGHADEAGVCAQVDGLGVVARHVIAADGHWSAVRR